MPDPGSQPFVAYRDAAILIAVLILYCALAWFIAAAAGPFGGDPDYQYLLSGLDILAGKSPNYYDHPGTPVQSLIALVVLGTWLVTLPFRHVPDVIDAVFAQPQFYLSCICAVFTIAAASAMGFFVWSFRAATGSMAAALIGLFFASTSAAIYPSFHHVSPEPLLLMSTFLLAGLVIQRARLDDNSPGKEKLAIGIGIVAALCVTIKVTSVPVLLVFLYLQSWREKKAGLLSFVAATAFFLVPILRHVRFMVHAYIHILTHQGEYGVGGAGPPSLLTLWQNILLLEGGVPEIFLCLALFILVLAAARILGVRIPRNLERVLVLSAGVVFFSILLVSKQPRPYYLIPVLAFVCLGNAILALLLLRRIPFARIASVAATAFCCYLIFQARTAQAAIDAANWQSNKVLIERAEKSGCLVAPYYIVTLPQWDLYFGNLYTSGREFYPRLERLYPNFVTYNGGAKRFETFSGVLSPQAAVQRFAREKCVYMIGIPWQAQFGISPKALDPVAQSRGGLALYSLRPGWEKQQ